MKKVQINSKPVVTLAKALLSTFAVVSVPNIPIYEDALLYTEGITNPVLTYVAKMRLFIDVNPMLGFLCFVLLYLLFRNHEQFTTGGDCPKT